MSKANKRKTPKTKPVYAWVAVWKGNKTREAITGGYWLARTRWELLRAVSKASAQPEWWRALRVLITPAKAKKGAKK